MTPTSAAHWDAVWRDRTPEAVTWFQADPTTSRRMIRRVARRDASIVDVGGGASTLVDHLLADGYDDITVLDISERALAVARERLGTAATGVEWVVADVTEYRADRRFDVWHDRAVFHFLVDAADRDRYRRAVAANVAPGGHLVVATFGPDGPEQCSGLPVERYDIRSLVSELGPVETVEHVIEDHVTPTGATQQFVVALFRFVPPS